MPFDPALPFEEVEDEIDTLGLEPVSKPPVSGFDPTQPFEEVESPEEQGILRQVADIPLGIARGGVTGIKMMTDILGADNPVSKSLSGVEGYMADLMSAQAKEDQQEISRIMKDAEDKGFGEQVKAGIKAFSIAPVDIMSQALGTMAPVIATGLAGSAAKLGALGMRAVQAGVGAGMGAGMIKGEIYNEVKNELVNSGIAEDAAEKAAVEAQSYGGKNLDQILLGAGLGAASTLGAEGIITRILTKQGTAPAAGVVSRVLKGGLTEAAPEAAQAAQEQLAKNVALQREGFDVDPSRGVVAAATMEAVAAAPLGGIAGAVERPAPIKTLAEENLEQTNEISRKVAENGAPLTASALQDQAAANLRQDELAKQLEAQLEEEFVAVKKPTVAPPAIQSKEEFAAIYSQVAPEELDAAEAGFTQQAATAATEEARANAQNALEAIKEVRATVTPPAPPVEPTITPAVQPAVPTAQPPITDATQEIIQPEGVRQEPQDRVEGQPPEETGVSDRILGAARGEEEGQVATAEPIDIVKPKTPEVTSYNDWANTVQGFLRTEYPELTIGDDPLVANMLRYQARVMEADKTSDPKTWSKEERAAYNAGDYNKFSRLRGYTEGEIREFNLYQKLYDDVRSKYGQQILDELDQPTIGQLAYDTMFGEGAYDAKSERLVDFERPDISPIVSEKPTEEEGQVVPTPTVKQDLTVQPTESVQPTISEIPKTSEIVGAEPAAIVEQEPVAPAEPTPVEAQPKSALDSILDEVSITGTEVTVEIPERNRTKEDIDRIIQTAKDRGVDAFFEGRVMLFKPPVREAAPVADKKTQNAINRILESDATDRSKISKLTTLALKAFPSSPNQKAIQAARNNISQAPAPATAPAPAETPAAPAPAVTETPAQRISQGSLTTGKTGALLEPPSMATDAGSRSAPAITMSTADREELNAQVKQSITNIISNLGAGKPTTLEGRGSKITITKSSKPGIVFQKTRLDENNQPVADREFTKEEARDIFNDQDIIDLVKLKIRPDLLKGAEIEALNLPGIFTYRLKNREHGIGTTPKEGFVAAKGRNVAFNRPLTFKELKDFEIDPIGAIVFDRPNAEANAAEYGVTPAYIKEQSAPTPVTPAETPAGIAVGNRVKTKTTPQSYVVEEVLPQSAREAELGEQYYRIKNERTGEVQTVEANDIKPVKGKGARKMATEIRVEEDAQPVADQYTFEEAANAALDLFGGTAPEGFVIVNDSTDPDFRFKAGYDPETGEIILNLAFIRKGESIADIIGHELGHYIFSDPQFQSAFQDFWNAMTPEQQAEGDRIVNQFYNKETGAVQMEEKQVRAFMQLVQQANARPMWQRVLDAIKQWINKNLGTSFKTTDRGALAVLAVAHKRFQSGEQIIREMQSGVLRMAAEPAPKRRKEQVGGAEREETRYITTPKGILSMNTDVLREKFFDGTSVSPEKTTQAWGYISRLLDIKSGNANEFAGDINDTVDADLVAKREAAIAAGEKIDLEEDVSKRIGAAMFSVELMNYAGRLAEQGDTRMLKFMIRNVNSMPTDKYAGDISDAARALRTRLEYDVSGFSAYTTEQKAKVDRTAAIMFGTDKPSKDQIDAVKDAIDESEKTELGNAGEVAGEVEKVEKRTKRKITDKIEKVIGKGSLKGMIQAIKDTPIEKQQDRGWIEKVVNDYLINAGLSPEAASTASKLYESLIAERFAAAKQKAFEDNLKKAAPWKNYAARNSRLAKDALNKVQAAIRTGVLDPEKNTESIIAAESGWSGFTKDQYQRIVQLDSIINDPKQDDVTRREAMADLNKVISDAKLPVRFKDALGAYYVGNALMGIPTLTVNIASPIGFTVRNLMTDVGKYAFTDPARIPVAFETFMESMRSWYDQTSYAFKNQIYLNDVVEYLQGQNVLRELFDKGKKQWAQGKYAEGFVNMAVGMTQITGRVLSSLDQGAISMLENQNITRYALEALANAKGKVPKDKLKEFANMVIDTRRKTIAENIANGMSRDRAGVLADLAVKSEVISALAQYDVNPMNVLDASINDALQSVGRNKTLTIKGIEQSQKNISDEGFMSYWPIKLLEMVSAGAGREGSSMQIFAKMLYGFALVPARVFHNVAWFSPYGFIRLGIDKYKKNKGEDSPYAMSLQTEAQYKQRLTEAIAGSVAMLGLAALSSASSDEDDDKKFKIVITGNGPNATTDKQYFDSWMKKWKPYSVHIVVNGNIIPINIGRGGEALFFPIMLAGALDDWKIKQKQNLTKKEPEDLSAIAQMLGSSFFALAQRGPYAAFTKPLFDASKDGRVTEELASQAGFFGKTFIPVLGSSLARNISDLFSDPIDRSSIEGAIYANTPVVGPWLGTKALNALGQPIRADDWGDKLFKLGVPVVFSFPKDTPMNELNELILKQGSGPTIPTRANAQKRFGDIITDKEFETYVREYGRVMSDKMFKNRTRLANLKPADYDDELEKYARGYSIDGIKIKGASDSAVLAVKRMRQ